MTLPTHLHTPPFKRFVFMANVSSLTHSVFWFDLDFGPSWEFKHLLEPTFPTTVIATSVSTLQIGKNIKLESSLHPRSQRNIPF